VLFPKILCRFFGFLLLVAVAVAVAVIISVAVAVTSVAVTPIGCRYIGCRYLYINIFCPVLTILKTFAVVNLSYL